MKSKVLLVMLFCIFPIYSFAGVRKIEVHPEWWDKENTRSLPSIPILSNDGNILFIYSDVPLENLQLQVKDELGNVFYFNNVSIGAKQPFSFIVGEAGDYLIELTYNGKYLWGVFEISPMKSNESNDAACYH